jgi:hypothetical protein
MQFYSNQYSKLFFNSFKSDLAIGTAGIAPYKNEDPCALRIYDFDLYAF